MWNSVPNVKVVNRVKNDLEVMKTEEMEEEEMVGVEKVKEVVRVVVMATKTAAKVVVEMVVEMVVVKKVAVAGMEEEKEVMAKKVEKNLHR